MLTLSKPHCRDTKGTPIPSKASFKMQVSHEAALLWEAASCFWQLLLAAASRQTWAERSGLVGSSAGLRTAEMSRQGCRSGQAPATLGHYKVPPGPTEDAASRPRSVTRPLAISLRSSPGRGPGAGLGRRQSSSLLPHDTAA